MPSNDDRAVIRIAIDTNVLLFVFYDRISMLNDNNSLQTKSYQNFITSALKQKNIRLYTSAVNLNEAFHVIEKTECDIYNKSLTGSMVDLKSFRRQPQKREYNKKLFSMLYRQVSKAMYIMDFNISKAFIKRYVDEYDENHYDCLDAAFSECCKENNIDYILTDDVDFIDMTDGVDVITANISSLRYSNSNLS